jgi:mannosyl-3-phosphoglycerate synthase
MRIESGKQIEHFGAVSIHDVRRMLELDSGSRNTAVMKESTEAQKIERESIDLIMKKMAIVLPIKNEDSKIFEGVLSGIPHDCLIIAVSNSSRGEIDNFKKEYQILSRFCNLTDRNSLIIHQKDPKLAGALAECRYNHILGDDGLIRDGKCEGMIIGIIMALLQGKEYVGFIDTDNYVPGSVLEYAKHYAAGFSISDSPYSMVRILWKYKPKFSGELYFRKWGRVSEITNKYLNQFISTKGKFETNVIKTGNAGEHAMSLSLASRLSFASGFGIETQELMSIFEQFSGLLPITDKNISEAGIDIIQTESINPHIHEERGEEHLFRDMLLPSLAVIYHNKLCNDISRESIKKILVDLECLKPEEDVPKFDLIPPLNSIDIKKLAEMIDPFFSDYTVPKGSLAWIKPSVAGQRIPAIKKIVFTDLDGTLLHPVSYSYSASLDSVRSLQEKKIPIVFCSAKTMAEQEVLRSELQIKDPFIMENGTAVAIPRDYFRLPFSFNRAVDDYLIIELGIPYAEIRDKLKPVYNQYKEKIKLFGDLSVEEVAKLTGINLLMAEKAKKREYSETMIISGTKKESEEIIKAVRETGLACVHGGKFHEIYQGGDKGKATRLLIELFKLNFGDVLTLGIGDSQNDSDMLAAVNLPVLVQNDTSRWEKLPIRNLKRIKGVGPEGWSKAVMEILT